MRWVIAAVVVLLVLAVWTAAYFLPELVWVAVAATVAIVLVVGFVLGWRWWRARAKAKAAERDANAPGPEARILGDMRRAVHAVKRSARRAGALPCVACIGPAASGKTTLVERSGLPFASARPARKGAADAPPRAFDWWWSPELLVLDVDGRLHDQSARQEWLAVVDALGKVRPDRPLDGVLVTVSAADLVAQGDFELQRAAAGVRAQLDDLAERLEMSLPVYCVITKMDRVRGFVDFWFDLPPKERSGAWGASFEAGDARLLEPAGPARAVEAELDLLAARVHTRVLERVAAERDPERRASAMRFPLELRSIAPRVALFVDALLRPDRSGEAFVFRGFYLTSAAQVDGAAGPHAPAAAPGGGAALASPSRTPSGRPPGESKSYFLEDVFREVILPDRGLATASVSGTRRRQRRELRAGLVALGVAAAVLVPAIASYAHNAELASDADAAVLSAAKSGDQTSPGSPEDGAEALVDTIDRLDAEAGGVLLPGWFGPRSARALVAPVRSAYVRRLHGWLLRRLRPELDKEIDTIAAARALADAPRSLDERTPLREAYETVKLYAMLVEPKGHVDRAWAAPRLAQFWRGLLPDGHVVSIDRLTKHAANYLTALADDDSLAWPPGRSLQAARDRLKRSDVRGLPYRRLLLAAADEPPIRASDVFGGASLEFLDCRGDVQVPGAYTAGGWGKIRDALRASQPWPEEAGVEAWVVPDANIPADDRSMRDQMRADYYDEYTRHWMAFLDELRVKTPPNAAAARTELGAFKEPDGFYGALFKQFKLNAIHDDAPSSPVATLVGGLASRLPWARPEADAAAPKSAPPSPVERSFKPLLLFSGDVAPDRPGDGPPPLEKYRLILGKLKAALDAPSDQPKPDVQSLFSQASNGVAALLDGVEEPTRGRLWRLLMPPVKGGVEAAKVEGVGSMSEDWKSGVWTAWDTKLSGRFPFKKGSADQTANFADFVAFFKPADGVLWAFVHTRLADWVDRSGVGGYVPKKGADPLSPELFECLTVAQEITDAFFRDGDEPGLKLSMQADWSAPDVSAAKVSIGGKDTALARGQWAPAVKWLGEDAKLEWVQGGRPTAEIGRHAFSLLDLFEQLGGLRPAGARGVYVAEIAPIVLKVRSEGKVDALRADFFARLRCPREIEMAGR